MTDQNDQCVLDAEGTCQHIQEEATASWIIPSGTHSFFGHTVSGGSPSDSAATESRKDREDNVADDLDKMLDDATEAITSYTDEHGNRITSFDKRLVDTHKLMQALTMYIVARDDKVLEHGRRLGQMDKPGFVQKPRFADENAELRMGHQYRVRGETIYLTRYQFSYGNDQGKIVIEGYTPEDWELYQKFCMIEEEPPYRTLGEVEGITEPEPKRFELTDLDEVEEVQE